MSSQADNKNLQELFVLQGLCKALDGEWQVTDHERESPDAIITGPRGPTFVELAGYVYQSKEQERQDADHRLFLSVREHWRNNRTLGHWAFRWSYRTCTRGYPTIPKAHADTVQFAQELELISSLIEKSLSPVELEDWNGEIKFRNGFLMLVKQGLQKNCLCSESQCPVVSSSCEHFLVFRHRVWTEGCRSTLNSGSVGFDRKMVGRIVDRKLAKAPSYKANAGEKELWLVIHSDGWPLSRYLGEMHFPRAIETVKLAISASSGPGFDRIYWLDAPGQADGGRLIPCYP